MHIYKDHINDEEEVIEKLASLGEQVIPDLLQAFKDDPQSGEIILKSLQKIGNKDREELTQHITPTLIEIYYRGKYDDGDSPQANRYLFLPIKEQLLDTISILKTPRDFKALFELIEKKWIEKPPSVERPSRIGQIWFKLNPSRYRRQHYWISKEFSNDYFNFDDVAVRFTRYVDEPQLLKRVAKILREVGEWEGLAAVANNPSYPQSRSVSTDDPLLDVKPTFWQQQSRHLPGVILVSLLSGIGALITSERFQDQVLKVLPVSWQAWATAHSFLMTVIQVIIFGAIGGLISWAVISIMERSKNANSMDRNAQSGSD